jgi:hypothetical protein
MNVLLPDGYLMRVCLILVAIGLAGCAPDTQYIRADGRYASPQSIEGALADCGPDTKDGLCMVEKGYFNVSAEQAEARRTQLAAIAEANEKAALAKAREEQERQAKAKESERRSKAPARSAEHARKRALDQKRQKRSANRSTPDASLWANPPAFGPVAPARR